MISHNLDLKIENYKKLKRDFKIRKSHNYIEFVFPSGKKVFQNKSTKFAKGLFLFRMVKKDVLNYIDANEEVEPYDKLPVNYHNKDYDFAKDIIGIDINNAYWRVAFLKGYISEKTYEKGIEDKKGFKAIRLSALSSLGRERTYEVFVKGIFSHDEVHPEDKKLKNIYDDIRFSTFGVMLECSELLGNDFHSWKTDCINFYDTETNRKKVIDFFESYNLEWKIEERVKKMKGAKRIE